MIYSSEDLEQSMGIDRRQLLYFTGSGLAVAALPGGLSSALSCERIVAATWGGDYAKTLETTVGNAIHSQMGATFVTDVGNATSRKSRLLAERHRNPGSIDVVCFDSFDMSQMASEKLLDELTQPTVPNLSNVLPEFRHAYSVPQGYSARVIAYNPEKMPAPKSYRDLWKGEYANKIGLVDLIALGNIESAAMISGGSPTNYEPGKQKLLELKDRVRLYPNNEAIAVALKAGEVWATIMWRARCLQWVAAGVPVAYAIPEEGATPITFEVAAPRNAPSKACAMAFLNRVLDPDAQSAFAQQMWYSPTVENAQLPPEFARKIAFSADERAQFFRQDFNYLHVNQHQLLDWWTRVFKA